MIIDANNTHYRTKSHGLPIRSPMRETPKGRPPLPPMPPGANDVTPLLYNGTIFRDLGCRSELIELT